MSGWQLYTKLMLLKPDIIDHAGKQQQNIMTENQDREFKTGETLLGETRWGVGKERRAKG